MLLLRFHVGWIAEVKEKLDKDSKIIVACIAGGTVKPSPNLADGSQSRSDFQPPTR